MENRQSSAATITLLLLLSIVGLALIPVLVLQLKPTDSQFGFRQSLIGSLYVALLLLGTAAAFYPAKCKGIFDKTQNPMPTPYGAAKPMETKGHHSDCQNFSGNRIEVGGRVLCAACSGLIAGATIALAGTIIQFFAGIALVGSRVWLLALGEFGLLLGLAQIKVAGFAKATLNAVFVVASFVTLAVADAAAKNLFVDLYALGLILFLLWFRISLSEWKNKRTCRKCQQCFQ